LVPGADPLQQIRAVLATQVFIGYPVAAI